MSWASWLKSVVYSNYSQQLPSKDPQQIVADSLMGELEFQMKEKQHLDNARILEEKRKHSRVDYTWLISKPPKTVEIPQVERLELETLCRKVLPEEYTAIIQMFHDSLCRETSVGHMPKVLKALIIQTLERRPKVGTVGDWLTRRAFSLSSIRPGRVFPSTYTADDPMNIEMQFIQRPTSAPARTGGAVVSRLSRDMGDYDALDEDQPV